ncbi:MAG: hypothetical protein JWQ17_1841 [Tardiphaga sp.]|nr:hypothetical protein [Tardiphaga sp.]
MASDRDKWADSLSADQSGGWLAGFLAEEDEFDRRTLWRLGSWGIGSVAAVVVALFANQSSLGVRRDQIAATNLMKQSQQIQWVAKESQNESRRLASAVDTLNSDRDRLYSRVSVLEQGLDTVTGSIARQSVAAASPAPSTSTSPAPTAPESSTVFQTGAPPSLVAPPPVAAPVTTMAAATTTAATSDTAPADKAPADKVAADKPNTVAALQPDKSLAASLSNSSAVAPAAPPVRPEPTNKASAAAITAPPVTTTAPLMPSKSIMAPPDPAATRLIEPEPSADTAPALPPPQTVANAPAMAEPDAPAPAPVLPAIAVQRTEFGVDLGGANSVDGLRALWRGLLKYRANKALTELRPIIVVKERSNGLGMQLRLVAGPLNDAAAAAKLCATLTENDRSCETTVFDGQRLAVNNDSSSKSDANAKSDSNAPAPAVSNSHRAPAPTRSSRRRGNSKGAKVEEPAPKDAAKPASRSLTSFLGLR